MEYIRTIEDRGDYYRCPEGGCELKVKSTVMVTHCDSYVLEPLDRNRRLRGPVRRGTEEWERLYNKRQSVERVFKSLKQSRRLEKHYHRRHHKVALHIALSALVFQATALVKALAGKIKDMRWMTSRLP